MKRYVGDRTPKGCNVMIIDEEGGKEPLDPRYDLRSHSSNGHEFDFSGSGAAQLSLAVLADALADDDKAQEFYQDFKMKVVSRLAGDTFDLSEKDIQRAVSQLEAERGRRQG